MTAKQMERCRQRLKTYLEEMLAPLGRSERRYWGGVYVRGLLLDGERKSAGAIATRLPEANEQNLQQFLSQSPWAWEPVWHAMAERIESSFSSPQAWVIDDTSFPKKGEHSVGVQRQYCGALGKKANCQVAVSVHRTEGSGSSPLGFRLYLPEVWTDDRERCRQAGVPDPVGFQKKWELALELIDQALAWGAQRPEAVLADSGLWGQWRVSPRPAAAWSGLCRGRASRWRGVGPSRPSTACRRRRVRPDPSPSGSATASNDR
jgi:SRSO17 transposase